MIQTQGVWFKDEYGRTRLLRGVNLGGSSKLPTSPDGATYRVEGFYDHRQVSFVGRPFPLEQADEHFTRLEAWGFSFLRLLVTWEAIEHAGPGIYDEAYLETLRKLVLKAGEYGMDVFIDPHQDVWSRFSGGDGAPGWTLEAAGLDMTHFDETGAAITHQRTGDPFGTSNEVRGPKMIWPTNTYKLAAATMFTLFFAGNDFAPGLKIEGEPIQDYLQGHYCAAILQAAQWLKDLPNVVGFETMNEPSAGYVGCPDLDVPLGLLLLGDCPTPYQSMLLGSGTAQEVEVWKLGSLSLKKTGKRWRNTSGARAWLAGRECVWKQHGVWDTDRSGKPVLLHPDYFTQVGGRAADFNQDYLRPFALRFAEAIQAEMPGALIFVEHDPVHALKPWGPELPQGLVFAPHWYDALTLLKKQFSPWVAVDELSGMLVFGRGRIRKAFARQLASLKTAAVENLGGIPTLLGEFGIPFDLDNKRSFRSGDFSKQEQALERSFRAVEDNLLSCMLWNYTPDNTNAHGDLWNDEDLSIFCRDQQAQPEDLNSGGRGLRAVVRPYAAKIAGEPLEMGFDMRSKVFRLAFRHDPAVSEPTEIFVPDLQYPHGIHVEVSDGSWEHRAEQYLLIYTHTEKQQVHTVTLTCRTT
jgi:hypothetical protein